MREKRKLSKPVKFKYKTVVLLMPTRKKNDFVGVTEFSVTLRDKIIKK